MTQEEKAKAYDEALERARKQRDDYQKELNKADKNSQLAGLLRAGISAIELAFPELAESEDERIRTELLSSFKGIMANADEDELWYGLPYNDIIAWLEKQEKEADERLERVKQFRKEVQELGEEMASLCKKIYGDERIEPHYTKRNALFDKYVENCDPEVMKSVSDEMDEMLEKEQKPVDYEAELKKCKDNPLYFYDKYVSIKLKPAKWSEEDEAFLKVAIAICNRYSHKDIANWLKSLPERFNLQPKQEWSEEDENMLWNVISIVGESKSIQADEMLDWLKSLRSQPKQKVNNIITPKQKFFQWIYDRLVNVHKENPNVDYMISFKRRIEELSLDEPSWKPSEEQMEAFSSYIKDFQEKAEAAVGGWNNFDVMIRLYEQLKKLM